MKFTFLVLFVGVSLVVSSLVCPVGSKTNSTVDVYSAEAKGRSRPIDELLRRRWPNNTIYVRFVKDFPKRNRQQVLQAMDALSDLTCLTIKEAPNSKVHAINIMQKDRACYARRGYVRGGAAQQIMNLHPICFGERLGTIIHELIHSIAFNHQHVRADRDEYVTIHKDRITKKEYNNFRKEAGKHAYLWTMGLPYDFNSVMHYPVEAFNTGKGHTISLKASFSGEVGQRSGPSRTDIAAINRLYECPKHYVGDDIPGALLYKHFRAGYLAKKPKVSKALRKWRKKMRKH